MLVATCLAHLLIANAQSPNVTFSMPAGRAKTVLTELGKAAKLDIQATPSMANEVLLISVQDAPVQTVLDKIAVVTSGEWKQDGKTYRLIPAAGLRQREQLAETNKKIADLRALIKKKIDESRPKPLPAAREGVPASDKPSKNIGEGAAPFPDSFAPQDIPVVKLLSFANLADLASLGSDGRIVFSSSPTHAQRPFTGNINAVVTDWVSQHNTSLGDAPSDIGTPDSPEEDAMLPPGFKESMARKMKKIDQPIAKVILIISQMPLFDMTTASAIAYDAKGNVLLDGSTTLEMGGFMGMVNSAMRKAKDKGKQEPTTTTPIEFSKNTQLFITAVKALSSGGLMGSPIPDDAKAVLRSPDTIDPLSLATTDSILAMAKRNKQQVIADLPDSILVGSLDGIPASTVEAFEENFNEEGGVQIVKDPAFLIIKPSKPAESRAKQLDREAMAKFLGNLNSDSVTRLEALSTFAVKSDSPLRNLVSLMYLAGSARSEIMSGFQGLTNWNMLRLYGQLSQGQREALIGGQKLAFRSLTQDQQSTIAAMVYGAGTALRPEGQKASATDMFMGAFDMFGMGGNAVDYKSEPTELLPTGLLGDGYIEVTAQTGNYLQMIEKEGSTDGMAMGADEMASMKLMQDLTKGVAGASVTLPEKALMGQETKMLFTFHVAPGVVTRQTLTDRKLPKGAKTVNLNALPAEMQKQIDAKYAELKKSPMGAYGGFGGTGRITPP